MSDERQTTADAAAEDAVVVPFPKQRRDAFDAYAEVHRLLLEGKLSG